MDGLLALYIFMLAAFTGYEIIAKVPVILHTPLMSGSNFIHGVVVVGAMVALGGAETAVRTGHRLLRRRPWGGQCRRRLCGDRAHARHVQEEGGLHNDACPIYVQGAWFVGAAALHLRPQGHEFAGQRPQAASSWAGYGMLIAVAATFLIPGLQNLALMIARPRGLGACLRLDLRQEGQDD